LDNNSSDLENELN
jgi:phosphatidylinositol-3,4,5-trisphosphate 3-phosphatase/dual-specificity protein phosphatase PTEN